MEHKAISRGWEVGRDLRFKKGGKNDGRELCEKRKGCQVEGGFVCKEMPIHFTIVAVLSAYNRSCFWARRMSGHHPASDVSNVLLGRKLASHWIHGHSIESKPLWARQPEPTWRAQSSIKLERKLYPSSGRLRWTVGTGDGYRWVGKSRLGRMAGKRKASLSGRSFAAGRHKHPAISSPFFLFSFSSLTRVLLHRQTNGLDPRSSPDNARQLAATPCRNNKQNKGGCPT